MGPPDVLLTGVGGLGKEDLGDEVPFSPHHGEGTRCPHESSQRVVTHMTWQGPCLPGWRWIAFPPTPSHARRQQGKVLRCVIASQEI